MCSDLCLIAFSIEVKLWRFVCPKICSVILGEVLVLLGGVGGCGKFGYGFGRRPKIRG